MLNPSELRPFCDEIGYLSNSGRAKFLQSKGIVRIDKSGDILIKFDKVHEYGPMNQEIDYALKKIYLKKEPIKEITTNDITADEIDI